MPYPNEHACRLANPGQFKVIRRANNDRKHDGKAIDVIYGKTGPGKDTPMQQQAFRYDKTKWTAALARAHCDANKGSFEAAKEEATKEVVVGSDAEGKLRIFPAM